MTTPSSAPAASAPDTPTTTRMVIGGESVDAADGQTFEIVNPVPRFHREGENDERTPGEADVRDGRCPSDRSNPDARTVAGWGHRPRTSPGRPRFPEVVRCRVPATRWVSTTTPSTVAAAGPDGGGRALAERRRTSVARA